MKSILLVMGLLMTFQASHLLAADKPAIQKAKALAPGDTIAIVAPSGPVDRGGILQAKEVLEKMGFKVILGDNVFKRDDYLAGTDEERAKDLMAAFANPEVNAVFPGRGGYGATRILDLLDFDVIAKNPKILMGYSDITALHNAIHQKTGLITFHSPIPQSGLGSGGMPPIADRTFWRAILADRYEDGTGYVLQVEPSDGNVPKPIAMVPGTGEGKLVGGNLSLVAAMMGTPYQIDTKGNVLFIEDVGEAPYRVDRMLQTMKSAGMLDDLAGVVLGSFTRRDTEDTAGEIKTIDDVLKGFFADAKYPVLANFPAGHQANNVTLPIGAKVRLDANAGTIEVLENPVVLP